MPIARTATCSPSRRAGRYCRRSSSNWRWARRTRLHPSAATARSIRRTTDICSWWATDAATLAVGQAIVSCGLPSSRALASGAFVMTPSRRQFLSLPALAAGQTSSGHTTRIVCVGGHPDDPESGCGGTLARYTALGAGVTIVYLTRGEAGIPRKSHDEAAAIRSAECQAACRILGAKAVFAGQIDGPTVVDSGAAESLRKLIFDPDVLFTLWPIDMH